MLFVLAGDPARLRRAVSRLEQIVPARAAGLVGRVRVLRQGGHPAAMQASDAGVNSRLDELQAAVLRVKLRHLDRWNGLRRSLAAEYGSELRGGRGGVEPPAEREAGAHVFHLYVARHPDRARLIAHLKARGVEAMIHYPYLLHQQPLFQRSDFWAQGISGGLEIRY